MIFNMMAINMPSLEGLDVEAQIDLKCLTLFHNICCQNRDSLEISIAIRQLQVNDENSNSWFIQLNRTLIKYGLKHPLELLEYPPSFFKSDF
jgi:hypothetical protein